MIFLSCHDCRVSPHPQSLYFVLDSRDHFQVGAAVACMVGDLPQALVGPRCFSKADPKTETADMGLRTVSDDEISAWVDSCTVIRDITQIIRDVFSSELDFAKRLYHLIDIEFS